MVGTEGAKPEKVLRLAAMRPGGMQIVRELTAREATAYRKAHDHLLNHDEAASLIEIVRRNLAAFENCVRDLSMRQPEPGGRGRLQREGSIDVNRHFLNFLAAVRQLLDHTETRLKRDYAETPEVFEVFRKRTVAAFDSVFAYRFLYKLRNFSQHCGAPVGVVDFESKVIDSTGMTMHTLHLLFDAEQLLRNGGDVWGPVRADLRKLGSRFPVDPLPREFMTELEAIWESVRQVERPHLEASAEVTLETVKEASNYCATPAVIRLWHRRRSTTIEIINPPVETMAWLGDNTFKEFL
jgi:hypothetical protein